MTPIEKNKALITRYVDAMNRHDIDAVLAMTAPDFVNHAAISELQDTKGFRTLLTKLFKAMPDLAHRCEDVIAEGDRVMMRVSIRGTQTGPFEMTRLQLPATGREVVTEQVHVFRIHDDKVIEHWAGRDDLGMLRQLGVLPAPKGMVAS